MNLFGHLVGLLGRGISPTQVLYLHRTTQHMKKRGHTSMPRAGFETAIPAFDWPKTVLALDRAAIGTGTFFYVTRKSIISLRNSHPISRPILILPPPIYAYVFQVVSSLQAFRQKYRRHFSSLLCVLHVLPNSCRGNRDRLKSDTD